LPVNRSVIVFMNSDLLAVLDYMEREKGIRREVLLDALTGALLTAAKKSVGPARELRVNIDPRSGEITVMVSLVVVEEVINIHDEISLVRARKIKEDAQIGDILDVEVTPEGFGRIAAQTAKQAILQRIRQAEKELIYDEFKDRAGEIVSGTVRRFERSDVIVDLGKFEAVMPSRERVQTEDYNIGDRIRAYVVAVENSNRGPEIVISRSHPNFVRRLFELEVSEIADRTVEIKAIAREAGYRTKIAVWSSDEKVDPVGACVGMRGSRVKNIVRELNQEKVDIIRWSEDPKEFVTEALKPAKIKSLHLDDNRHAILVTVDEEQLSLAIGRRGQNARLTDRLTGWKINISKDESANEAFKQKIEQAISTLAQTLKIDEETARSLASAGVNSIEGILEVQPEDIADILGIDIEAARKIHDAARAEQDRNMASI
jgi:transcription termination/antitermination protein NusA